MPGGPTNYIDYEKNQFIFLREESKSRGSEKIAYKPTFVDNLISIIYTHGTTSRDTVNTQEVEFTIVNGEIEKIRDAFTKKDRFWDITEHNTLIKPRSNTITQNIPTDQWQHAGVLWTLTQMIKNSSPAIQNAMQEERSSRVNHFFNDVKPALPGIQ